MDVDLLAFPNSTPVGGEWRASRSSYFTHAERALGTHSVGARVETSVKIDVLEQKVVNHCETNGGI